MNCIMCYKYCNLLFSSIYSSVEDPHPFPANKLFDEMLFILCYLYTALGIRSDPAPDVNVIFRFLFALQANPLYW